MNPEHVRAAYDRWSTLYDDEPNPLLHLDGPAVRNAVGDVRGRRVLELGCGTGRHSIWLASRGAQVTALDFSTGMLSRAAHQWRQRQELSRPEPLGELAFIEHDLSQPLPFETGSFELVLSSLVLEHLSDLPAFFAESHRVLGANGRAIISTMHPAMFLRQAQARFTDPESGELVVPGSIDHPLGAIVMAALRADFQLTELEEHRADEPLAERCPRAERYLGWPMLLLLQLRASPKQQSIRK
ncbi:MAG: class I SAM-dependent methyltransferase [Myxococcota bacterium]|jgi:malonyl-CoA O-methyltransferase|nr:class I SAM-dependent methyltransferase [Myxococcota bacterium]